MIPEIKSSSDSMITVEENGPLTLKADITETSSVCWFHNGVKLENNEKVEVKQAGDSFSMTVLRVTPANSGEYMVESTSSTGHIASKIFTVTVQGIFNLLFVYLDTELFHLFIY